MDGAPAAPVSAPVAPAAPQLACSQCGGILTPAEGQVFLTCPFCSSTVYLDRRRVVFHWAVACTVDPAAAEAALRRWMAGNATVKDLDQKAHLTGRAFQYFPLWYFKCATASGEQVVLEPGAAIAVREVAELALPAGDLLRYDPALDAQALAPDVTLQAATGRLAGRGLAADALRESALVHVPLYRFTYEFGGQSYAAVVDGAAGRVLAAVYPAKPEVPYLMIAAVGMLAYFAISWIPLLGYMLGEGAGLAGAVLVYALAAALVAVPLFLAATVISSRV